MTITSKPWYSLECDICDEALEDYDEEKVLFALEEDLLAYVKDSDWLVVDGKHYCPNHADEHEREAPTPVIDGQCLLDLNETTQIQVEGALTRKPMIPDRGALES